MNVGIYFNKNYISENKLYLDKIIPKLESSGVSCCKIDSPTHLNGLDILFVLGGDGTILTVAAECAKRGIKLLGINYGHLGFLTEFEPDKIDEAVELFLSGKYTVKKRTMLEVQCGNKSYIALNDLVIQRSTGGHDFSNTVSLRAEIDGAVVDNYTSDGIIVSTPTGSTAYSLSAGGSVLAPNINAFIMTPICAHSLHSKPVVYSDNSILKIVPTDSKTPLNVIVDGRIVNVITHSEVINVKKSEYCSEFITRGDADFFNKLLQKLSIWSK